MAVNLRFFVDLNGGRLSASGSSFRSYQLPALIAGDTVRLNIGLIESVETSGPGALTTMNLTGYSCKVAVGTEGSPPLTSATLTVSQIGGVYYFVGSLPMNTTGIEALFTGTPTASPAKTFELEFNDGTGVQTVKQNVTLRNELITSDYVAPPAPDAALGKNEAGAIYLKTSGVNGVVLLDQSGGGADLFIWNDAGTLRTDPVN